MLSIKISSIFMVTVSDNFLLESEFTKYDLSLHSVIYFHFTVSLKNTVEPILLIWVANNCVTSIEVKFVQALNGRYII